jgi:hypothetical protein
VIDDETFTLRDSFQPFSNGTEHRMWLARNCELGCRNYRPDATTSRHGCPMEVSMSLAAASDGQMPARHGLRCGLLEPAHNGLLHTAEGDPTTWRCPEYRGDDEPDDRPRRGPRPSAGQTDLFDPRGVPARAPTRKVAA